ncbi:hypothetical protein Ahy_B05g076908 [Arachis hypogaea]|uniref:Protein FAR1-RELATED SEQUENCE n=1 Tax=Arachis hypogaea TaxID=3818 RepID=A0A444Z4F0_ARAHY|nr:hypothetical protein Ahy_B05g076908 [Arachis hypogaea]
MRRRELVADYKSAYGYPVVKIKLEAIEQFAATVYTKEVFELFQSCFHQEDEHLCFLRGRNISWVVASTNKDEEFSYSCHCMESFGLLCVHMVRVLVYLNMTTIPRNLILDRWIKRAKQPSATSDRIYVREIPNAAYISMNAAILEDCRELVNLSCRFFDDYFDVKTRLAKGHLSLQEKHRQRLGVAEEDISMGIKLITKGSQITNSMRHNDSRSLNSLSLGQESRKLLKN